MRQNTDKKPLRFRLCVVVSACVYMGSGVCVCVWMRVFKLSQFRKVKRFRFSISFYLLNCLMNVALNFMKP